MPSKEEKSLIQVCKGLNLMLLVREGEERDQGLYLGLETRENAVRPSEETKENVTRV